MRRDTLGWRRVRGQEAQARQKRQVRVVSCDGFSDGSTAGGGGVQRRAEPRTARTGQLWGSYRDTRGTEHVRSSRLQVHQRASQGDDARQPRKGNRTPARTCSIKYECTPFTKCMVACSMTCAVWHLASTPVTPFSDLQTAKHHEPPQGSGHHEPPPQTQPHAIQSCCRTHKASRRCNVPIWCRMSWCT